MKEIWKKYADCKPTQAGFYAVIEDFGNINTVAWKNGKFTIDDFEPDENGVFKLITHITYWAYLEDIVPEIARQGFVWERRGQV